MHGYVQRIPVRRTSLEVDEIFHKRRSQLSKLYASPN